MIKIVFLGTTSFSIGVLQALTRAHYSISAAVTQPDRQCGRGKLLTSPLVKVWSQSHGLRVLQPEKINKEAFLDTVRELAPDLMIVASYGQILRGPLLKIAPLGCLNVHASLLPRYRGADPIRWAILNGEEKTGVSIMLMDEGIDTGPVIATRETVIEETDNGSTLEVKLGKVGGELLVDVLPSWIRGEIEPVPQNPEHASYAGKISKNLLRIQWDRSADDIVRQIRAFAPCPGAYGYFKQKRMKVLKARVYQRRKKVNPGQILEFDRKKGLLVGTGDGILQIEEIHPENRKPQTSQEFCCGYRLQAGDEFR